MLGEQRYTTGAVLGWDVFSTRGHDIRCGACFDTARRRHTLPVTPLWCAATPATLAQRATPARSYQVAHRRRRSPHSDNRRLCSDDRFCGDLTACVHRSTSRSCCGSSRRTSGYATSCVQWMVRLTCRTLPQRDSPVPARAVCFQSAVVFLLTSPSPDQDGGNLSNFSGTRSGQALPMEVPSGGGTRRVSRETLDSDNRVVKLRMSKIDLADEAALPENRGGDQESGGRRGSSLDGYSGVRPGHAHRLSWSALPGTGRGGSTGALVLPPTPATEGNDDRRLSVPAVITRPWPLHSNSDSSSNTSVSGPSTSKL